MTRQCSGCTACCEGHLHGHAHGHKFFNGRPCHFMNHDGCSIYQDRPIDPCVTYRCAWLMDTQKLLPEWMKPSESGVIISERTWGPDKKPYWEMLEMGKPIKSSVLIWFMLYHTQSNIAMSIQVERGWYYFGPPDFVQFMTS